MSVFPRPKSGERPMGEKRCRLPVIAERGDLQGKMRPEGFWAIAWEEKGGNVRGESQSRIERSIRVLYCYERPQEEVALENVVSLVETCFRCPMGSSTRCYDIAFQRSAK